MIVRYSYGSPLTTGAVVMQLPAEPGDPEVFSVDRQCGGVSFTLTLAQEDMIFGLGEAVRGINKRGHRYRAWNSDDFTHVEGKECLYASHNLLLFAGEDKLFGAYFDDPGEMVFDLAYTRSDTACITSLNGDLDVYILTAGSLTEICREMRRLTGRSYVPPKWAMGYIQSRWGYDSDRVIRTVVAEHRSRHIPLDGMSMDIDYMDHYKDFTWNKENFPSLRALADDMRGDHIHLVPIIDAGVKQEEGYDVCDEGLEQGYFVRKADGKPFVGAVWPGRSYFPDFLRADVRAWFGSKYHTLMREGVEGFWNDMNEPALFYSEETLQHAFDMADRLKGRNLGVDETWQLKGAFEGMANSREDYCRFYHELDGKTVRHDRVHNIYGAHMTRAAAEGFRAFDESKRYLIFSRSSFIGAHRYGGVWQGDNSSWWSHILLNLRMMPSLNMAGFLYCGADLGGFSGNTTEDLLERWLQLGVFTPLMRNHAAAGTREQEIYRFSTWEMMRDTLTVRYALIPYLYSEMMLAALTDGMMFRPLAFDYPQDRTACHTEDQVMLGRDCMIAPVYEQNAVGRHVYLPEDMLLVRFRSADDYDLIPVPKGHLFINLKLNELPLFIRKNHVIPLAKSAEYVEGIDWHDFTLLGLVDEGASVETSLYNDDGVTTSPTLEGCVSAVTVRAQDGNVSAAAEGLNVHTEGVIVG